MERFFCQVSNSAPTSKLVTVLYLYIMQFMFFWLFSGGIRSYKLSVVGCIDCTKTPKGWRNISICGPIIGPTTFPKQLSHRLVCYHQHYPNQVWSVSQIITWFPKWTFLSNKFKQFQTCQITCVQSIQKGDPVSSAIIHPNVLQLPVGKFNATPRGEIPPIQTWSWTNTWDLEGGGMPTGYGYKFGCQTNRTMNYVQCWYVHFGGGPVIVNLYDVNLNITIYIYRMNYTHTCIICTCTC